MATQLPLDQLGAEITARLKVADDNLRKAKIKATEMRLAAALQIVEARRRVGEGEAGDMTWDEWRQQHIKRSRSYVYKLLLIGRADNPEEALDAENQQRRDDYEPTVSRTQVGDGQSEPETVVAHTDPADWRDLMLAWNEASLATQARFRRYDAVSPAPEPAAALDRWLATYQAFPAEVKRDARTRFIDTLGEGSDFLEARSYVLWKAADIHNRLNKKRRAA